MYNCYYLWLFSLLSSTSTLSVLEYFGDFGEKKSQVDNNEKDGCCLVEIFIFTHLVVDQHQSVFLISLIVHYFLS